MFSAGFVARTACIAACTALCVTASAQSVAAQTVSELERGSIALADAVHSLGNTGRVLIIGAHPDDENSPLIAWLSRGRHVETGYLSLTRGESGQNQLNGLRLDALGVVRTQEALAARRLDGARQYYTRAFDFGFAKTVDVVLKRWPRDSILGDIVRVVRAFRPQVIISMYTGTSADGDAQHEATGMFSRMAFDASGDTLQFSVALHGPAWSATKFYRATRAPVGATVSTAVATAGAYSITAGAARITLLTDSASATTVDTASRIEPVYRNYASVQIDVGEYDAVSGRSYYEIAAEGRTRHKSQGASLAPRKGAIVTELFREASQAHAPTDSTSEQSLFDGIDTTWARLNARASRAEVRVALDSARQIMSSTRAMFRAENPSTIVQPLAQLVRLLRVARDSSGSRPLLLISGEEFESRSRLVDANGVAPRDAERSRAIGVDPPTQAIADAEIWNAADLNVRRAERALVIASGVALDAVGSTLSVPVMRPGQSGLSDSATVELAIFNRGKSAVRVLGTAFQNFITDRPPIVVEPDSVLRMTRATRQVRITTQWWRLTPRNAYTYTKTVDARDEGARHLPRSVMAYVSLEIAGTRVVATTPVVYRDSSVVKGETYTQADAVPGIVIGLVGGLEYIRANTPVTRELRVRIQSAYQSPETVTVTVPMLPPALVPDSAAKVRVLTPDAPGAEIVFTLKGTLPPGRYDVGAVATHRGGMYGDGYFVVSLDHIPPQRMYRPSSKYLEAVDVIRPPRAIVGYISGVDDEGSDALIGLDIPMERLDPLVARYVDLSRYASIVVGPRAYAAFPLLESANPRLLEYVKSGGTLVVQGGETEMLRPGIMPYPIQFAAKPERVSDAEADVTVLKRGARQLTVPNRIVADDWKDWVVDRAPYLPTGFDARYTPLVQMHDADEPVNNGGILVARHGLGTYIYVPLSLNKQLRSGVPGAARLFVNLITPAGQTAPTKRAGNQ